MTSHEVRNGVTLGDWIAGRSPAVPLDFRPFVRLDDPDRPGDTVHERVDGLTAEALAALERVRARDAGDRAGAFDLLAADAWATWAAEAALEARDPVATLTELARRLADPDR